ncbi:hypothetical protein Poli38472_008042 [Pythium oligandrum]|uniref:Uncharacterized protein n=1 Tax=Pythium oligandrum TaxID=41045 RepID=A0A8K1FIV2_PYTOL|nr:hypothetical protein Poli38472_008042 [Pythium oligandrum]|eukprot:TMW65400.1 hypothetical protein Poli38472_008042 [Pythium oligandrum]
MTYAEYIDEVFAYCAAKDDMADHGYTVNTFMWNKIMDPEKTCIPEAISYYFRKEWNIMGKCGDLLLDFNGYIGKFDDSFLAANGVLSASTKKTLWISKLSCPLLITDCSKADISGSKSEIQALWEPIELGQVLRLVIRHCPELEIPASIDQFKGLKSLKVYNSTVVRWDDTTTTIKSATHPLLHSLQFVRTNFSGSVLPPSLWSAEFPRGVTVIEFCITNLAELPALVASRWPQKLRLTWEASSSSNLFPLLLEMNPTQLSLARNDLVSIPADLLEVSTLVALSVAHTPIAALPFNVSLSSTLEQLSIVGSTVSEMPSWFYDDLLARPRRWMSENLALFAGGSLYCQAIATRTITNGDRIVCASTRDEVSYPLDQEDAQSAFKAEV